MPTLRIAIGTKKSDNTFPVYIRLTQHSKIKYLPTGHYVVKSQLTGKGALKDTTLIDQLNGDIKGYRERLMKVENLNGATVDYLKDYLLADDGPAIIDFISFGREFIKTQTKSTGKNTEGVLNSMVDFLGMDKLNISEVNLTLLNKYAAWLKSERSVTRKGSKGETKKTTLQPLSDTGIRDYIGKLRQIFIAARTKYNDEDRGKVVIPHYPFLKFKMPKAAPTKKRNVKVDIIKAISKVPDTSRRADLGRDVFMLSFYLVGINTVDLFNATQIKSGRLVYNRAKTASRKGERAQISIKIESEALPLLEKYKDQSGKRLFNFWREYANADSFSKAVNLGLKSICEILREKKIDVEDITSYYARHSWATIARNVCKVSKDDIHFALNHSDPDMKVTDLYIEEDFSIIDEANRKVLDTLL